MTKPHLLLGRYRARVLLIAMFSIGLKSHIDYAVHTQPNILRFTRVVDASTTGMESNWRSHILPCALSLRELLHSHSSFASSVAAASSAATSLARLAWNNTPSWSQFDLNSYSNNLSEPLFGLFGIG